ncbi:pyrroloquinoline quinone precursor peptide PqqA [Cohnella pontilimi]|uniref:Coenzyme PQQ synthesis protein A n=1 Tax=Cohnella pontilimi TaxID=2564100 RepID=A0A4U0FDG1_9BACL|nr:pyrroloquinoline quinone precursor peptide PqqA [Cohnella pontilimi]
MQVTFRKRMGSASLFLLLGHSDADIQSIRNTLRFQEGGVTMWVKPEFKIVELCAEVTAYAYRK